MAILENFGALWVKNGANMSFCDPSSKQSISHSIELEHHFMPCADHICCRNPQKGVPYMGR